MKKSKYEMDKLVKFKNVFSQDVVFSSADWPIKNIDGVIFVGVKISESDKQIKWMRKDSLERTR